MVEMSSRHVPQLRARFNVNISIPANAKQHGARNATDGKQIVVVEQPEKHNSSSCANLDPDSNMIFPIVATRKQDLPKTWASVSADRWRI
jgi:hypothetical protein